MDVIKLEKLRIATNQFYLNKYLDQPLMTDEEYDLLRNEYEADGASVKDLVEWDSDLRIENEPCDSLSKIIVRDGDFEKGIDELYPSVIYNEDIHVNYKYDGSSIKAYYINGKLKMILGTPDESFGIVRTKAFWNLFPHELEDKSIKSLQGEVLVDAKVYGQLARNKANGLTNSKLMDEEVESECFIRIYKVTYHDTNEYDYARLTKSLNELPKIKISRNRPIRYYNDIVIDRVFDVVFSTAVMITRSELPTDPIVHEVDEYFQVDGVVVYSNLGIQGFKFYYTEYAITTVTEIHYDIKHNGSYAATIEFEEVELNGKTIRKASSGGIRNMMEMGMGIGAKVKVILANLTIPKIIEVINRSEEFDFPTCECGHQLTENDIFGSVLKCTNEEVCSMKVRIWTEEYSWLVDNIFIENALSWFIEHFFEYMTWLKIDRWDAVSKCHFKGEYANPLKQILWDSISLDNFERYKHIITENFEFSELQYANFEINARSVFEVSKKILLNPNLK